MVQYIWRWGCEFKVNELILYSNARISYLYIHFVRSVLQSEKNSRNNTFPLYMPRGQDILNLVEPTQLTSI